MTKLINKEMLKNELNSRIQKSLYYFNLGMLSIVQDLMEIIDAAPIVEERKHGRWITIKAWHVECSECRYVLEYICCVKNYCPNCGAIMDGKEQC